MTPAKKYRMSRLERQNALIALKACKPYLWNGTARRNFNQSSCICYAIGVATNSGVITLEQDCAASNLISRSLGTHAFYEGWMAGNGVEMPAEEPAYTEFVQAQRLRWVNHLIKSLEKSLK